MALVTCSIILCTRNRFSDVLNFLKTVVEQIEPADELIIIDSSDATINEIESFKQIFNKNNFPQTRLVYKHTSPGLTYQRNVGISIATKEIIYFFDDDTILEPDYL